MNDKTKRTLRHYQSGQAIVLVALMIVALLGITGLALDGGGLYFLHRDTQNAVDAAVLAATYAKCTTTELSDAEAALAIEEAAVGALHQNGYDGGINNTVVVVHENYNPDTGGDAGTTTNYVKVTLTAVKTSYFIQLVYPSPLQVTTSGVGYCQPSWTTLLPPATVVSLRDNNFGNNCGGQHASARFGGTGEMLIHGPGIFVNSAADCALLRHGSGSLDVDGTCWVYGETDGINEGDPPECNTLTDPDPYEQWDTNPMASVPPPDVMCDEPLSTISANNAPGYYGDADIHGDAFFEPGFYCFDSFDYQGGVITGHGVVFYFQPDPGGNGGMHGNGNGSVNLSAPTIHEDMDPTQMNCDDPVIDTCAYAELLIWSDFDQSDPDLMDGTDLNDPIEFNGNQDLYVNGMVYSPRSFCQMNGTADQYFVGQMVCWGVDLQGTALTDVTYDFPAFLEVGPRVSYAE